MSFDRSGIRAFRFVRAQFDAQSGEARLVYAFDDGPEMVETLTFPGAPFTLEGERATAVEQMLRVLHLIAGVSYYKAAVPPEIHIESYTIGEATAAFLTDLYEHGLAEFAYRNGLSLRGAIKFPFAEIRSQDTHVREPDVAYLGAAMLPPMAYPLPATALVDAPDGEQPIAGTVAVANAPRALVAIGGGKDSLVSIELLRAAGVEQTVAWIGGSQLIRACSERTGLPTLNIGRQLAPELFELNRQGALNGHIPVTAVNSAILALAALLTDHDHVVFSNERSASYGSIIPGTGEVNHQWSKGWDFERGFAVHLHACVAPHLRYYSLLRPLSELAVARQFAKLDRYDAHFSSCNRNFHLLGERPAARWCGVCPKCHFVFLALAPFMPKPRLMSIFGRNLLDDVSLAPGFDALIEYRDHKPFECVGEGRESRAAFHVLSRSPAWREDALVARYATEIEPQLDAADLALEPLLIPSNEHGIPAALWERIGATLRA
jgi:hypothetical protein